MSSRRDSVESPFPLARLVQPGRRLFELRGEAGELERRRGLLQRSGAALAHAGRSGDERGAAATDAPAEEPRGEHRDHAGGEQCDIHRLEVFRRDEHRADGEPDADGHCEHCVERDDEDLHRDAAAAQEPRGERADQARDRRADHRDGHELERVGLTDRKHGHPSNR